ncbi:UDP-N-acetyl glucosamine 2-epimerase [Bacillus sp. SB49]|uniref:hypothetical protein n=1 Tax=Bacillus sp. SB49 TaxID=1071080 RepID=UPI0012685700|nr:hypothetical protein [Bacillus sp. SB49]QHT45516.1 UDP-N-acetyl glucosamine 2-epimerase [Bacillus sp. SB49]
MTTMNQFERRYWSSYCDFINDFKALNYLGISLPLVMPYYVLIHENAIHKLKGGGAEKILRTKIVKEKSIQAHFEKHLAPYRKKVVKRKGRVVFYDNVLRIPSSLIAEQFKPGKALLLMHRPSQVKSSIPSIALSKYETIPKKMIDNFKKKANRILLSKRSHLIYGNKHFKKRLLRQIPVVMKQIFAANKFFASYPASCLVLGTTNSSDTRILALTAASKGIPSICLQHGIPLLEFGYLPRAATYLGVYGTKDVAWYTSKGVPPAVIKVVGHPRFDEMVKRKPMSPKVFQAKFKLVPTKKTILLVLHHQETEIPQIIIDKLLKTGKYNILIKPRNGKQSRTSQTLALQQKYKTVKFANGVHLYDLLQNVDAVVSYESTIVMEALLAGKPAFIWKLKALASSTTNYYSDLSEYIFQDPNLLIGKMMAVLDGKVGPEAWNKKKDAFIQKHYPVAPPLSITKLKALITQITL